MCSSDLLVSAFILKVKLFGFSTREWVLCGLLILGAQILGHTMFNLTLKRVSPVVVSLIIFFEVPVSAILAAIWLHQKIHLGIIPGLFGLILGCALFVVRSDKND